MSRIRGNNDQNGGRESGNQGAEAVGEFDTVNYPYYRFKELTTLCVEQDDRLVCGLPVRAYWHDAEKAMTVGMKTVLANAAAMDDPEKAGQYITDYCNAMQQTAFDDAGKLLNAVRWYRSKICNTMKNGRNPETHEIIDEKRKLEPMEVALDPSVYRVIPEVPAM